MLIMLYAQRINIIRAIQWELVCANAQDSANSKDIGSAATLALITTLGRTRVA